MLSMCVTRKRERRHCVSSQEMRMQLRPWRSAAFFALLLALLFSTSLAGRQQISFLTDQDSLRQQGDGLGAEQREEALETQVHARMLKAATTSDYGSYDPSPSMDKPHFKLIPN